MTAIWKDSMEMRSSDLTGTCTVCSAANFKYVFKINFAGSGTERTTGKQRKRLKKKPSNTQVTWTWYKSKVHLL